MIRITCKETLYTYDMYHITKAFFPNETIEQHVNSEQEPLIQLEVENGSCFSVSDESVASYGSKREKKHYVNKAVCRHWQEVCGKRLAWGILTGIRPTKIVMGQMEQGQKEEEIAAWIKEEYFVSEEKIKLSMEVAAREKALLEQLDYKEGYSLYVGIPFCPSICSYCSFSSSPIGNWKHRVDEYLDALCREILFVAEACKGKKLNTVYVGGGTPTTLEAHQMERLLGCMEEAFDYDHVKEITVEAGRPDSISKEKLQVLRNHGVSRISINPQTMQDNTLREIGRMHSVADVKAAFSMARELGFDNINMDLIAGLPGEDVTDMEDTLGQIESLQPDSVTIHALAIKRAAKYGQEQRKLQDGAVLEKMIELGFSYARSMGMVPYYLYRQKNIAGNFENVGYAKVDKAGIYNILIMEEKQSIIAVGAGASTKIVLPGRTMLDNKRETNIVRIENVKDIDEYITRIDEMIERKEEWLWR